jgi:hypothetical protein
VKFSAAGRIAAVLIGLAVTVPALADARAQPIKNGFYSSLTGVRSSDVDQTTAWKGTATSPACTKLPRGGGFTLFGPIAGE